MMGALGTTLFLFGENRFRSTVMAGFVFLSLGCSRPSGNLAFPDNSVPQFSRAVVMTKELQAYESSFRKELNDTQAQLDYFQTLRPSRMCQKKLRSVLQNGEFRIRFSIGYEDWDPRDEVSDLIEQQVLAETLQKPCANQRVAMCGFQRIKEDSFRIVLEKIFESAASAKPTRLVVNITSSSVSTSNKLNESDSEQMKKSKYATNQFIQAFEEDDLIIYWGHGRDGGGPDFAPPVLTSKNETYYPKYRRQKQGYGMIAAGLGSRYRRTHFLGLFGCNTTVASQDIRNRFSDVNFMTSNRLLDAEDLVRGGLLFPEAVLQGVCASDFYSKEQVTKAKKTIETDHPTFSAFGPYF